MSTDNDDLRNKIDMLEEGISSIAVAVLPNAKYPEDTTFAEILAGIKALRAVSLLSPRPGHALHVPPEFTAAYEGDRSKQDRYARYTLQGFKEGCEFMRDAMAVKS